MSKTPNTPIKNEADFGDFIENRRKELGLSKPELVQRLGYKNIGNGCKHYHDFISVDIDQPFILENLHHALSVDPEILSLTLERAREENIEDIALQYEQIAAQRLARELIKNEQEKVFKVHGTIEIEKGTLQPRFMFGLTVKNLKHVELESSLNAPSYVKQIIDEIQNRVDENGTIPPFGVPTGFAINFSPDHVIRYDIEGNKLGGFKVHGIIETEKLNLQPRFMFGMILKKMKYVDLELSKDAPQQMIDEIHDRVGKDRTISPFGIPLSFVINFSPAFAIRYDLDGNKLEVLDAVIRLQHREM